MTLIAKLQRKPLVLTTEKSRPLELTIHLYLGFAAFWIGQLVFPTIIFFLTIAKAVKLHFQGQIKNGIITTMLRDGE